MIEIERDSACRSWILKSEEPILYDEDKWHHNNDIIKYDSANYGLKVIIIPDNKIEELYLSIGKVLKKR